MQAHHADGARTMADWTAARLDVSHDTARRLVSTARGLEFVPVLEAALADGRVSYERAVELVRAVTHGLDVSDHWAFDIGGLRRVVSKRRGRTGSDDRDAFDARHLVLQPSLDQRVWRIHGQLDGLAGAIVETALDRKADEMTECLPHRPARAQRRADALVALCGGETVTPEVVVFVDADGGTVNGLVPAGPSVVEASACLGRTISSQEPPARRSRNGRRSGRKIPAHVRRAVLHRDGGMCVMDGCSSRYRLQPHHLVHREHHGTNDPDNLVSLCWYHHHVEVHRHGRRIDPASPPFRRRFLADPGRSPPR
jgi:hypothetical protein